MTANLFEDVKRYWGKYKSIPIIAVLIGIVYLTVIFSTGPQDKFLVSTTGRYVLGVIALVLLSGYIIFCCIQNKLPCAPKGTVAILFVITAENDKVFESVRYKLVENFQNIISSIDSQHFTVLCVPKERVSRYNFSDKQRTYELLERTNSLILVDVKYFVDDVDNAEHFEMAINYGIVHPEFDAQLEKILAQDMDELRNSVGRRQFVKAEKIQVFKFTAYALSYIFQYILGFVCLLSGDTNAAIGLLGATNDRLGKERSDILIFGRLKQLVPNRLYVAYMQIAQDSIANFQKDKGSHYLRLAQDSLTKANQFWPDTYDYYLLTAYVAIALNRDLKLAKNCVGKCKESKEDNTWKYSDAFLSAYQGYAFSTIVNNYKRAFEVPYHGMVDLADYVEYILEMEPDKNGLHLAAGLIYENLGDARLMKKHFSLYMDCLEKNKPRIEAVLKEKMLAMPCDVECRNGCKVCSEQDFG